MKAVRYIALAIVGLIVLAIAAVAVAVLVIDPNTYKPQIEKAAEDATNLDLILEGDIGWSFIPPRPRAQQCGSHAGRRTLCPPGPTGGPSGFLVAHCHVTAGQHLPA